MPRRPPQITSFTGGVSACPSQAGYLSLSLVDEPEIQ